MKKFILIPALVLTACMATAQNGAYVEFKIASSKGPTGTVKTAISDYGSTSEFNMVVPQMPGGAINNKTLIQKSTPDIIYTLNDKTKTYSETKQADAVSEDKNTYTVKRLGDETVNGYKCTHALVTESGGETHEVWNTKDIPDFEKYSESFRSNKRIGSQKRETALKAAGCDGMPVKTLHKGNAREGDMTMELVKLEKKNYSKADFEIPAGYTKGNAASPMGGPQMKSQQEIMKMTPEERAKFLEDMKKQHGN